MKQKESLYALCGEQTQIESQPCERKGCEAKGEFRAPKSPHHLREYYWFCLDHIRDYNKTWDFYQGMTQEEINASRVSDVTWNRPSWPLGAWRVLLDSIQWQDGLEFLAQTVSTAPSLPREVEKALAALELAMPLTAEALKKQYKKLVKCHHPDLHAGDKQAEERLKRINIAYHIVKTYLKEKAPGPKREKA